MTEQPTTPGLALWAAERYNQLAGHRSRVRRSRQAPKVGRGVTIGGFSGAPLDRTWSQVDRELEKSRAERGGRDGGLPPPARGEQRRGGGPAPLGLLRDGMVLLERATTSDAENAQLDTENAHHPDTRRQLTAIAGQLLGVLTGWLQQVVG